MMRDREPNRFQIAMASAMFFLNIALPLSIFAGQTGDRWWPVQSLPKALVRDFE